MAGRRSTPKRPDGTVDDALSRSITDNVRRFMDARGLKPADIAEAARAYINRTSVFDLLANRQLWNAEQLRHVAAVLDVRPHTLLVGTERPSDSRELGVVQAGDLAIDEGDWLCALRAHDVDFMLRVVGALVAHYQNQSRDAKPHRSDE